MYVCWCVCMSIYLFYLIFYLYIQGTHFSRWLTQKKALNKVNIIYLTYGGTNSEYMSEVIIQKLIKKHVILKDTDLVFIDYSMNDAGMLFDLVDDYDDDDDGDGGDEYDDDDYDDDEYS